jgi:hypothetical protein
LIAGNYPSTDFEIVDEGSIRKVRHLPTGMLIETGRLRADPIAGSAAYTLLHDDDVTRPGEIAQAALRHLRVWLMRDYGSRGVRSPA